MRVGSAFLQYIRAGIGRAGIGRAGIGSRMAIFIGALCSCSGVQAEPGRPIDRLPDRIGCSSAQSTIHPSRPWTIEDVVGVTRITGSGISADGKRIAFVIRRSFVDSGEIAFALYVLSPGHGACAKKVVESRSEEHTSELQSHLKLVC